jgi:hypothetical protein
VRGSLFERQAAQWPQAVLKANYGHAVRSLQPQAPPGASRRKAIRPDRGTSRDRRRPPGRVPLRSAPNSIAYARCLSPGLRVLKGLFHRCFPFELARVFTASALSVLHCSLTLWQCPSGSLSGPIQAAVAGYARAGARDWASASLLDRRVGTRSQGVRPIRRDGAAWSNSFPLTPLAAACGVRSPVQRPCVRVGVAGLESSDDLLYCLCAFRS